MLYINTIINKHIFTSENTLKKYLINLLLSLILIYLCRYYSKILNEDEKKLFEILYIACQENNEINYLDENIQIKLCINYIKNNFKYNEFFKKMILNNSDMYYYNLLIKSIPFSNISKIF